MASGPGPTTFCGGEKAEPQLSGTGIRLRLDPRWGGRAGSIKVPEAYAESIIGFDR